MKKRVLLVTAFIMVMALSSSAAWAEYPDRPVQIVVCFKAGGTMDTIFRVLAQALGKELGTAVVVSNTAGAGGTVAAAHLKRSEPDGYTLGASWSGVFTIEPVLRKTEYAMSDFDFIGSVVGIQPAFVSSTDKPWKTWQDMIDDGKKKGDLTVASQNPWDKFAMKFISEKEGFSLLAVPTKGGGEMVPAVLGGHVDLAWSGGVHYKYAKSGKMRVLAACTSDRLVAFPDVPTLKELGYDLSMDAIQFLIAPKGLPIDVKTKLEAAMAKAFKDESLQDLLQNKLYMKPIYLPSAELVQFLKSDQQGFKAIVDKMGK